MSTPSLRLAPLAWILLLGALAPLACKPAPQADPTSAPADGYLFCFWNVENLFDDRDDRRTGADQEFDDWFASNAEDRQLKYDHLAEALLRLNAGKGPDILAIAEVESIRAAELLRDNLNARLPEPALHYQHVLMKDLIAGRHIATAILTRLPVQANRTQLLGKQQRILEAHITVNGHDLAIIASHWTARVSDKEGHARARYADVIYGTYRGMMKSNPNVDLLICGDFNDPPDADSVVRHLHAIGDINRLRDGDGGPSLFNLFAGKDADAGFGTHNYQGLWLIFDQIVVSPALIDGPGWRVLPDTVQTVNTLARPKDKHRRPWRFGSPRDKFDRGYSDHFPVTVRIKVAD